jgi:hypothetical protein
MSDLFTAPEPAAGAPRPKRPAKTRKGLPPLSGAWYGPQERVWLIPNPYLPDQPYRIQLSLITGVSRSAYATCCFIRMRGVPEPILVNVSDETILKHAPWAADKPAVEPKEVAVGESPESKLLEQIIDRIDRDDALDVEPSGGGPAL